MRGRQQAALRYTLLVMLSKLIADVQVAQLSWHGKNDVLMWSMLLSVLCVAAVKHLLEASASQQKSSLAATAICWACISIAAAVTFRYVHASRSQAANYILDVELGFSAAKHMH